ncbi:MAG TPA: excinuclease ABC subunit C [Hyphomonas sp.]|jgi:excinuclease ABC subunit C|uniref:excinuclease ABC subunit UvrC n=3 Tax=Hyphomonas TaxID=85 RepID=UPI000C497757|nr:MULTISPECIES: excinuclease ABC subunit UvrC [unclassified Hyphomonas]MAL47656.1 excinuclease ABC subunit C [Hyphomonas sp.]MAX85029.1 excinuclease ABC subunit C [Hyphomonas sp.]QSR21525.1 excinuclease ABC subunit C [Hyphomonas sp. KY3]HBT34653.1 excinuclease ABC subunit C [Hyphomonas sp.]HBU34708.1 excinuclease ABC subunit C [Hyphomonas sp.]|tara:strand:+ start:5201 stop:7075 length:1875 start_codon:yes stop_codon:yes gene_type:complete
MNPTDSGAASLRGIDVIKDNLKRLPAKPGVYRMFGEHDDVLYVGKARDLKARVSNYARLGGHTQRIARMISMTKRMEFVVTETETEALLLEASLIKSLKPRFNVLLRDDKSFPYILIRRDHEAPQIKKYRGSKMDQGDYFGPFASAGSVMRTLDTLQKAFLLRTCEDSVYSVRTRPCMLHQIKRCAAPCVGLIETEDYQALADQAADFLRGKGADLQKRLAADMEAAADDMEFERAARLRDRIRALAHVRASQDVNPEDIEEADVFAIEMDGGVSCVQVFFIRAGQNWGATAHYPRHEREQTPEEVLSAFLVQFYDKRPPPKLILVNKLPDQAELIADALELKAGRKVEVRRPERGSKKDLVTQAARNAGEALSRKLAETASQTRLLAEVAKVFELETPPERIEIYDNSHIQGTNAVGGMVVAGPEGFIKNAYRKFNIKDTSIEPGDDYGMMREVMRRRFSRALKEREEGNGTNWPDLVLIDGGLGQLNAVIEALAGIGVTPEDVNLVSIAKGVDRNAGREQFFRPGRAPFKLPETAPVLYYLQRLRDEAHRWAIGAHRAKRSAAIKTSPLDEIEGVGPTRKKALLHHFGSAKGVSRAKVADLMEVDGVNEALAERIWGHFNSG